MGGAESALGEFPNRTLTENEAAFFYPLHLFYYTYMPFCVIVGLTGNCMVWVLIRSNRILSKLPTNAYLLCLAAVSSMFLVCLFFFWLEEVSYLYFKTFWFGFSRCLFRQAPVTSPKDTRRNQRRRHKAIVRSPLLRNTRISCKLVTFIAHYCDFCSVWLIVLVGFERLVLLHRRCRTLSVDRAYKQILALLITVFVCNSWILVIADVNENKDCDIDSNFEYAYMLFTYFEAIFCMALPSVIIIVSNVLVVLKLRTHLKRIPSSPTVSFHTAEIMSSTTQPSNTLKSYTRLSTKFSLELEKPKPSKKSLRYTDLQLTRSLLVVTWAFILLNLPNYVYRAATSLWTIDHESVNYLKLCVHMLLYTHHAFLFYLYIFYSPQMKRRLRPTALKLLECYCLKPVSEYSEHT